MQDLVTSSLSMQVFILPTAELCEVKTLWLQQTVDINYLLGFMYKQCVFVLVS